jgi:hypothetical protein
MAQDMLAKVRALSETADSYEAQAAKAPTPERRQELLGAADSYRAKAEQLMRDYRITQEDVLAKDATAFEPVLEVIDLCGMMNPYRQQYVNMFWHCSVHVGARVTFDYLRTEGREWRVVAKVVGYEHDVRYAEMLFTAASLVFAERLEPKVKPELSDQVNAYRLRAAGIERVRVSEMLWGHRNDPGKVGRLYAKECAERGEQVALTGRGVTGKVYREQYADEFLYTLSRRLQKARNAADSVGGGLVLHGRQERVEAAFYGHFPHLKPSTDLAQKPEPCAGCKKAASGVCRACRAAANAYERDADKRRRAYYSAAGQAGRRGGAEAATYVELSRTDGAKRLEG